MVGHMYQKVSIDPLVDIPKHRGLGFQMGFGTGSWYVLLAFGFAERVGVIIIVSWFALALLVATTLHFKFSKQSACF